MNIKSLFNKFYNHEDITKLFSEISGTEKEKASVKKELLEYLDKVLLLKLSEIISLEDQSKMEFLTKLFNNAKIDKERFLSNIGVIFNKYYLEDIYNDFINTDIPKEVSDIRNKLRIK